MFRLFKCKRNIFLFLPRFLARGTQRRKNPWRTSSSRRYFDSFGRSFQGVIEKLSQLNRIMAGRRAASVTMFRVFMPVRSFVSFRENLSIQRDLKLNHQATISSSSRLLVIIIFFFFFFFTSAQFDKIIKYSGQISIGRDYNSN